MDQIVIGGAFLIGAGFSLYILTHLKQVIETAGEWRAASIGSLCISALLFFTVSHPKITKIVADVAGSKVELSKLTKKIEEKQVMVSELENQIVFAQSELVSLQAKMDETYIARVSKPMADSLKEYQKEGKSVAVFPGNQIAINPKLAAKATGTIDLPEKFQKLSSDSWIIIQNGLLIGEMKPASSEKQEAAMTKTPESRGFILQTTGEAKKVEPLTSSESMFLKTLIQNTAKPKDK